MASDPVPILLVTANVGSIFEDPSVMLKMWTKEFLETMIRLKPKFVALHCQEVGGKNYEESMQHVEYFVKLLMESDDLKMFDKVRIYLDEDYSSAENFTALGNFYFIHESISDVLMWDFEELCFIAVEGKEVFAGNIEDVSTKEKSKFPQDFFPECKWSRKGFQRTRWNLNGTVFDLINIHLFHDASNFVAMETFPSVYSKTRQRALEYTLDRFHNDKHGTAPFFLFGDFNFRTDTKGVIKKLSEGLNEVKIENGKNCKLEYKDSSSQVVFSVGKKEFSHFKHQSIFAEEPWLKEFDKEMEDFCGQLFEFPINFPPSYPFVEDSNVSADYMQTRCPAWCDRVVLSETAKPLIASKHEDKVEYSLIGINSCMGDHKPVYLTGYLTSGAGRLSCCDSYSKPNTNNDETVIFDLGPVESDNQEDKGTIKEIGPIPTPLTERFIVKRVHSASIVEVKVGLVKVNSCRGNDSWRSRSCSVSGAKPPLRAFSRMRLISSEASLTRVQSHHSSSSEEWFEEEEPPSSRPSISSKKKHHKRCCVVI